MSEVSARQLEVESLIADLSAIWDQGGHDVPDWVAEELTFGQMRLLFLLSKRGPSPVSRVAEWLEVGLPTASGIVDRLERHGLVTRQHRLDDRRVVECDLTDKGRQLIEEIAGMRTRVLSRMLVVIDDKQLADLGQIMRSVLAKLKQGDL